MLVFVFDEMIMLMFVIYWSLFICMWQTKNFGGNQMLLDLKLNLKSIFKLFQMMGFKLHSITLITKFKCPLSFYFFIIFYIFVFFSKLSLHHSLSSL
jgi:hypothetical protein